MAQEKEKAAGKESGRESKEKFYENAASLKKAEDSSGDLESKENAQPPNREDPVQRFLWNPRTIGVGLLFLFLILVFRQAFLQNPFEGIGTPEAPPDAPDQSATAAEFRRIGIPDWDRIWTGEDMAQAEEVLSRLSQRGFQYFPRYESERSGAVFARLTSLDNLKPFTDSKVPLSVRFSAANQFLGPTNQILELYFTGQSRSKIRVIEVVEVMALQLHVAKLNMELVEQAVPELDKSDPKYPERMGELEGVKRGIAGLILGGIAYLTEGKRDRQPDLKRLVIAMQETFPPLFTRVTMSSRETCLAKLDRVIHHPRMKDLKPDLIELKEKVLEALSASDAQKAVKDAKKAASDSK